MPAEFEYAPDLRVFQNLRSWGVFQLCKPLEDAPTALLGLIPPKDRLTLDVSVKKQLLILQNQWLLAFPNEVLTSNLYLVNVSVRTPQIGPATESVFGCPKPIN
jgi:hypothetical protein